MLVSRLGSFQPQEPALQPGLLETIGLQSNWVAKILQQWISRFMSPDIVSLRKWSGRVWLVRLEEIWKFKLIINWSIQKSDLLEYALLFVANNLDCVIS